jgi:hypothetical protein
MQNTEDVKSLKLYKDSFRLQVLTAVTMKKAIFWDVMLCTSVGV